MNLSLSAKINIFLVALCGFLIWLGTRPKPNKPPAIEQNQGVAVSCVEVETTKPDGTKTREIKFSAVANQTQKIVPINSAVSNYRVSFIPNWSFGENSINYGFVAEKRLAGELFAGAFVSLDEKYKIKNVGGSLSYGF